MVFETDMDEMILEKGQKVAHFNRSPRWSADLRKSGMQGGSGADSTPQQPAIRGRLKPWP